MGATTLLAPVHSRAAVPNHFLFQLQGHPSPFEQPRGFSPEFRTGDPAIPAVEGVTRKEKRAGGGPIVLALGVGAPVLIGLIAAAAYRRYVRRARIFPENPFEFRLCSPYSGGNNIQLRYRGCGQSSVRLPPRRS